METLRDVRPLPLRAHHGMCLSFFEGKGYDEAFTLHMGEIKERLERNEAVCLTEGTDAICACCPHQTEGRCRSEEKVNRYDAEVLRLCGLKAGETIAYRDFARRVEKMILQAGRRREICGDCQWDVLCGKSPSKAGCPETHRCDKASGGQ